VFEHHPFLKIKDGLSQRQTTLKTKKKKKNNKNP
jgi:hypothetical protein